MRRAALILDAALMLALVVFALCIAPVTLPWVFWWERREAKRLRDARGHWSGHP